MGCESLRALTPATDGRQVTSGAACDTDQQAQCKDYCVTLFSEMGLRLRKTTCEVLPAGSELPDGQITEDNHVHCQCKAYWWFW